MSAMKVTLQKLSKGSEGKEACITLQEEKIAKLTKKLEKRPTECITKDSESEDEVKASIHNEASDEKVLSKKSSELKSN